MKISLRSKLTFSYIFLTLLLVTLISLFTNIFLETQFRGYIIKLQVQRNEAVASHVQKQYTEDNGWDVIGIENIGVTALENGIIMKVTDSKGKIIWDAKVHNNGLCVQILSHMADNMKSRYPNFKGGYEEMKYPIKDTLKEVGIVNIGYYGPYYLMDNDLIFINSLNFILLAVGIFSFFFALLLGLYMANRISTPITKVVNAAGQISKGFFEERITDKTDTKEFLQLTSTINNLAETLGKQVVLRKRMAADVAHELRTPLATLQSHMEALIDGIWKPDIERFKSCHEEIMRINRMVGDTERLARLEGDNVILDKSQFDVSELIRHILANFEVDFKNNDIMLSFTGEKEVVEADQDKLSQVIINLISNALKYTPKGGRIEVEIKGTEDKTEIFVRDNGNGIAAEDLPYIFERFYRADQSRNRLTGGSGIGLTIAKAIIELHKGEIIVHSELNKGTEFIVLLPKYIS